MENARVFVLNAAGHDFSAARKFTKEPLVILTEGSVPIFNSDRLHYTLEQQLASFSAKDYLLLSGAPLLALLAVLVIKEKTNLDRINVLLWSATKRQYIRRVISLRGTFTHLRADSGASTQGATSKAQQT